MKTIIKIHSIEITIEDEVTAPAAIATPTTQAIVEALQAAVQPMPASTVQPKARKVLKGRAVEPASTQPEPIAPAVSLPGKGVVEPIPATTPQPETPTTPTRTFDVEQLQDATFVAEHKAEIIQAAENGQIEPSKKRLNFEEFDKLVRAEMKRLAPSPGQMPSHSIWNEMRTPPCQPWARSSAATTA